jgi:hypothetical protein
MCACVTDRSGTSFLPPPTPRTHTHTHTRTHTHATGHPGEEDVGNWILLAEAGKKLSVPFVASGGTKKTKIQRELP